MIGRSCFTRCSPPTPATAGRMVITYLTDVKRHWFWQIAVQFARIPNGRRAAFRVVGGMR